MLSFIPCFLGSNGATIGRHSASNDIVISESFVSRKHCEIIRDQRRFWLRDTRSTTGTFVMLRDALELKEGTLFQMGLSEFKVIKLMDNHEAPTLILELFEGPTKSNKYCVTPKGMTIGRELSNTIAVPEDTQMSGQHARIASETKQGRVIFYLIDAGSTNK